MHLPEVVVDDLPLDDRMKIIIQHGYDTGEPDLYESRSEAVCAVILAMLDAEMSHEMMCSVLTAENLDISGYCRDDMRPVWCAMRQIQRVKERLYRG